MLQDAHAVATPASHRRPFDRSAGRSVGPGQGLRGSAQRRQRVYARRDGVAPTQHPRCLGCPETAMYYLWPASPCVCVCACVSSERSFLFFHLPFSLTFPNSCFGGSLNTGTEEAISANVKGGDRPAKRHPRSPALILETFPAEKNAELAELLVCVCASCVSLCVIVRWDGIAFFNPSASR